MKSLLEHREGLTISADHPATPMDNNRAERSLRNPVVGGKNYYGSGSLWSARATAVDSPEGESRCNEYIDRYHYLGHSRWAGATMRYIVETDDGPVALFGFSASAYRIAPRDQWIGWSDRQRVANLQLVVNNSRFLILPWIYSRNLGFRLVWINARRLADDRQQRYRYRPVLPETFVQTGRFTGTCYKAANWRHVGTTTGRGRNDVPSRRVLPKKEIFPYPLTPHFRATLCFDSSCTPPGPGGYGEGLQRICDKPSSRCIVVLSGSVVRRDRPAGFHRFARIRRYCCR